MNILVTGGAGCIGSDLCEALAVQGHRVRVTDNLSSGKRVHLEGLLKKPGFEFVEGDLCDLDTVDRVTKGVEFVYHMAANPDVKFTPGEATDPGTATDKDLPQNTICTYNVVEAMRRHGVRELAFASASAVYGIAPEMPNREDSFFPQPIRLKQDPARLLILSNGLQAKSYLLSEECVSAMLFAVEHAEQRLGEDSPAAGFPLAAAR
jgi:UDP-glucose 4-epimerase